MSKLLIFSVTHPRTVIFLAMAAALLSCVFIPRIQLKLDARSLVPRDEDALRASDEAARIFGLQDVVILGVVNRCSDIYNDQTLGHINHLSKALSQVDGVVPFSIRSISTTQRLSISNEQIDMRPILPDNFKTQPDPAAEVRRNVNAMGLNDGVLVSKDGQASVILGEVRSDADRYEVMRQVKQAREKEQTGNTAILLSGTSLAQAELGQSSAIDLMRLVPLVILVLAIGLIVAFRHVAPAVISLAEIMVSLICTAGLMGLSGQSVFVTTLVLPVVLLSVGVSDDVYALKAYFHERSLSNSGHRHDAVVKVFKALRRPIALTTTTTVVGLLSMAITPLEPLRVFGIFSALSILFSTLCSFTLVPALIVVINPSCSTRRKNRRSGSSRKMLVFFNSLVGIGPPRLLATMALLAVCALLVARSLRVDDSWVRNLPQSSEIARGDKELNEHLAGTTTLELMIDSGHANGFLEPHFIRTLGAIEEAVGELPFVGASYSVSKEIDRISASLDEKTYADFRESIRESVRQQIKSQRPKMDRLTSQVIERSLLMLSLSRRGSIDQWVDKEYRRARISLFIRSADYQRIRQVLDAVRAVAWKHLPNENAVTPFGDGWISYTTVRLLVEGQVRSIIFALLTDFLLLMILLNSIRASLMSITPVALSVIVVFAVLALTGVPLGIANSMFTGIALGIGCDFAVHLTVAFRQNIKQGRPGLNSMRHALVRTGPAIITSAATIASGFLILTFSSIRPNMELGLMICLCLTTCALMTLVIVPSLALSRRKLFE
jgi:predicted RND superfamily exporter protein